MDEIDHSLYPDEINMAALERELANHPELLANIKAQMECARETEVRPNSVY